MKLHNYLITALTGVFLLVGFPVGAQTITYNFDDDVNPFSAGTISTDQAVSGTKSLQLTGDVFADWNLPSAYLNKSLQVTMSVFDEGRWRTGTSGSEGNGPRWGVGHDTAAGDYVAATIVHKNHLDSASAYGMSNGTETFLGQYSRNEWFGVGYMGSRASGHLSATANDGSTGSGTWTTWTFDIDFNGDAIFSGAGSPNRNFDTGQSASALYLFGGDANGGGTLAGMYVDDVTVTVTAVPEPGTLGLLALGLLLLLGCKRRRC